MSPARRKAPEREVVSGEQYRSFLQQFHGIAYRGLPKKWKPIFFHGDVLGITGYTEEELVAGTPKWSQVIHPDDFQDLPGKEELATVPGYSTTREYRVVRKDGVIRWVQETSQSVADASGRIEYIQGTIVDITAKKRFEMSLLESEERFRRTFETSNVGMAFGGLDGGLLRVNQAFCRMLGYTEEEFLSKKPHELTHPDDRGRMEEVVEKITSGESEGLSAPMEKRYLHKDGRPVWTSVIVSLVRDTRGKPLHSVVQALDISKQRQAEEARRESEQRFREMAENIQEVFWLFDWIEQRVIYVSPAYEMLWGRSAESLYRNYGEWGESIHPEDRVAAEESFVRVLETGGGEPREYRVVRPDGEVRWISDRAFAIRDKSGRIMRITGVAEDITERKMAEEELKRSKENLERQYEELREVDKLKDSLLRNVSHELKTPVAKHSMQLEILRPIVERRDPSKTGAKALEVMEKCVRRQESVISNLLNLSYLEARGRKYERHPIVLRKIIEKVADDYREIAEQCGMELVIEVPAFTVESDSDMLWHLFSNIIHNAIKFRKRDRPGKILICAVPGEEETVVQIADEGMGLSPEEREKVFESFYQATPSSEGSGVGLSICRMITEGLGGRIEIASEGKDMGVTVSVALPHEAATRKVPEP